MGTPSFAIEIILGNDGVRSVRVLGQSWDQSAAAHALLSRISPLIQKLDAEAKSESNSAEIQDNGVIQ